jgi:hypothetical protein
MPRGTGFQPVKPRPTGGAVWEQIEILNSEIFRL